MLAKISQHASRMAGLTTLLRAFVQRYIRVAGMPLRGALAIVLAGAMLEGFGLSLLIPFLSTLIDGQAPISAWTPPALARVTPEIRLLLIAALLLAVVGLRALLAYAKDLKAGAINLAFADRQRARVMRLLTHAAWNRLAHLEASRVANLIGTETQRVATAGRLLIPIVSALLMLSVQMALAMVISPLVAIAGLGLLMGAGVLLVAVQVRALDHATRTSRAGQAFLTNTAALMGMLKSAAAQESRSAFADEFDVLQQDARTAELGHLRRQSRRQQIMTVGATVVLVGTILLGVLVFAVPLGAVLATLVILVRMVSPVLTLQSAVTPLAQGLAADRLFEDFEVSLAPPESADGNVHIPPHGPVVLDSVCYLHPGGGGVRSVSLSLAPGAFVGVTGPSGHGKTTLVDLIAGLLEPQAGAISIGGRRLDEAHLKGWRGQIGYVAQDTLLFPDTLRRNLSWGNANCDPASLDKAITTAGLVDVVARLGGLDARVGERGMLLSGGERQRVAIARALLRQPRLLVLDESTSGIDEAGEAALLGRIANLTERPTILFVTHRSSALARCNLLLRVTNGEVHIGSPVKLAEPS